MSASASRQLNLFVSRSKYHVCPFVTLEKSFKSLKQVHCATSPKINYFLDFSTLSCNVSQSCMYVCMQFQLLEKQLNSQIFEKYTLRSRLHSTHTDPSQFVRSHNNPECMLFCLLCARENTPIKECCRGMQGIRDKGFDPPPPTKKGF